MRWLHRRSTVERQVIHAASEPEQPDGQAARPDRSGTRLVVGLALAGAACIVSYLLGIRYDYRGWLFVAPFLSAAAFALVLGASMRPLPALVASAILATALIVAFGLGLDGQYWFADPSVEDGFRTWVMISLIAVPVAWLIGVGVRYVWPRTQRSGTGSR